MLKSTWFLILLAPCMAQQTQGGGTGVITGTLTGEDGTPIIGASVTLQSASPLSVMVRQRPQSIWNVRSGDAGEFRFEGLSVGSYRLCAQAPGTPWLNPCEWNFTVPTASLTEKLPNATIKVALKKGAVVPIRLDDETQLLEKYEGKTAGAHLLIGVGTKGSTFQVALTASKDFSGSLRQVVIPFDITVNLVVASSFFKLTDAAGTPLSKTTTGAGTAIPILVPSGTAAPILRLKIAGVS
jgi:hypothetical protein